MCNVIVWLYYISVFVIFLYFNIYNYFILQFRCYHLRCIAVAESKLKLTGREQELQSSIDEAEVEKKQLFEELSKTKAEAIALVQVHFLFQILFLINCIVFHPMPFYALVVAGERRTKNWRSVKRKRSQADRIESWLWEENSWDKNRSRKSHARSG